MSTYISVLYINLYPSRANIPMTVYFLFSFLQLGGSKHAIETCYHHQLELSTPLRTPVAVFTPVPEHHTTSPYICSQASADPCHIYCTAVYTSPPDGTELPSPMYLLVQVYEVRGIDVDRKTW